MSGNKRSSRTSTEKQIEDLTNQLAQITLQLTQLQEQLRQEREQAVTAAIQANTRPRSVQIGDLVRITNNYQNLQETEGRVIKISTSFVTIRTADRRQLVRGIQNIEIILEE